MEIGNIMNGLINGRSETNPANVRTLSANSSPEINNNPPAPKPTNKALLSREKFMKKHLAFLIHAKKCEARDREQQMNPGETMISVMILNHLIFVYLV